MKRSPAQANGTTKKVIHSTASTLVGYRSVWELSDRKSVHRSGTEPE